MRVLMLLRLRLQMPLFVVLIALQLPASAAAQAGSGSVAGIVRDSSGASVPGASIDIANVDTGVAVQAFTDGDGAYRVDTLAAGRYRIETMLDGFEPDVRSVSIDAGQTLTIAVSLSPARLTE